MNYEELLSVAKDKFETADKLLQGCNRLKSDTVIVELFEMLVLSLRELLYYTQQINPIFSDINEDKIKKIIDMRNAICHRSSPLNQIEKNIVLRSSVLFKKCILVSGNEGDIENEFEDDVALINGKNKIYIIRDIILLLNEINTILHPKNTYDANNSFYL